MEMKHPALILLLALLALPACQTTRRAAVSTFRVIDAPHEYMRRQLGLDQQDQRVTTTTTTETNVPPDNVYQQQTYSQQPVAPPPTQYAPQRRVVSAPPPPAPPTRREIQDAPSREPEATATPAPRVTSRSSTNTSRETVSQSTPAPKTSVAEKTNLPYGKPVPGKAGYVYSPYDKNGGYVDVTGFAPGSKVKDPYSGKVFLVP